MSISHLPRLISELPHAINQQVTVGGWIHAVRNLGGVQFVVLRDGSATVQLVLRKSLTSMNPETVVRVTGIVSSEPRAPQGIEIREPEVEILSEAANPLPIDVAGQFPPASLPTRLNNAAVALRHPQAQNWIKITAHLVKGFRDTLSSLGFVEIHTPKILEMPSESGANVFQIEYFGRPAYLAQSPQFYKQMMVGSLGRVFEVGPVFRAEPHDTARHLSQYTSLDAEVGFIEDHHTVMDLAAKVVARMLQEAKTHFGDWPYDWPLLPETFPVVHFKDAMAMISRAIGEDVTEEPDLSPAHEAWLGEWARSEFGSDFLFVEGYPALKRPFYTHPDPENPQYTRSFDLIFRGQELITGGQRLYHFADYVEALKRHGLSERGLSGYLAAFRYGMPPHGGFAIGLERFVARLTGVSNIRDVTLFPRDMKRLQP
jgi:nondiscriminating aspartyl-tRNA synthetase